MAEFLLLFRGGAAATAGQSPEQMQAQMQKWVQWMEKLTKQGKMAGAQPLEPAGKTVSGKKKVVSDGPFAEGKELVGGYLVCKADSIEEAVEISKECPLLEHEDGVVEVRAIRSMEMPSH
jgi:hypothetical protein